MKTIRWEHDGQYYAAFQNVDGSTVVVNFTEDWTVVIPSATKPEPVIEREPLDILSTYRMGYDFGIRASGQWTNPTIS